MRSVLAKTGHRERLPETVAPLIALCAAVFVLHVTGIHCPIKYLTGVSCPGCGMTRAWMAFLSGRVRLAFAYHPLFWLVPAAFVLAARHEVPGRRRNALLLAMLVLLLVTWVVRLTSPQDALILSGGVIVDVVGVTSPPLLDALRTSFLHGPFGLLS